MHNDILVQSEDFNAILLPKENGIKNWESYEDQRNDFTSSSQNLNITGLYAGYPYSQLQRLFKIVDFSSIINFISQNPSLYNTLLETVETIRKYFFEEELWLEKYEDPEGEMDSELSINILTYNEPAIALNKLEKFDTEYWSGVVNQHKNMLSINIEYL